MLNSSEQEKKYCSSSMQIKPLIIAVGNQLAGDEGIGAALLKELELNYDLSAYDSEELGSRGLALLYLLEGRKKVLLIDCAFMNLAAASFYLFKPEEVRSLKKITGFSLHENDILKLLAFIKEELGEAFPEVTIAAIQPVCIQLGTGLSPQVKSKLKEYAQALAIYLGLEKKTDA